MKLTIDDKTCDLACGPIAVPGFDARDLSDAERCREGRSLRLTLPVTPANDRLLGFPRDPHGTQSFNMALHTARLTEDDAELLAGTVRLLAAADDGFRVEIRTGGVRWAKNAAKEMFNTIPVAYEVQLTPTAICNGWTDNAPVKFLPVQRDEYPQKNSSSDLLPAERLLSVDDYHPFLNLAALFGAIAGNAGYRIESRFFETDLFRSLYLSGAYPARDTEMLRRRMDFCAGRLTEATTTADRLGRVYANPFVAGNSVGNLVEIAKAGSADDRGEVPTELHDNGNCFETKAGKIGFRPLTAVSAGFEYFLRYTTAHRILTRERLLGIDSVYLGPGNDLTFALANRYPDRRGSLSAGYAYRVVVFDHETGAQYRLTYTRNLIPNMRWTEFSGRTAAVTTPPGGTCTEPALQVKNGDAWLPHAGDWALYDGHVQETGQTTVEVRVRTPPEALSPTAPKNFNTIYFHGGEEGTAFTLHRECRVRPCFSAHPGYGEAVRFTDVAQLPVRQIVLLNAVQHLFNLRFYTDEAEKRLCIEPADNFYDRSRVVDWSAKTDFSQPVEFSDLAATIHERRTWCYSEGDGATARFDAAQGAPFGSWTAHNPSRAALEGEQRIINPLFTPTVNAAGHYANAPTALLPQVGNRDDPATAGGETFTPRIVRYCGMHPLPAGERWGYPSNGDTYPLAAFHFAGDDAQEGFTLCFEDRDGQQGLHRRYDRQAAQESMRQQITLWLRIEPREFEALFRRKEGEAHIGSVFRLDVGRETVLATLARIETYDPQAASTRCTFTRLLEE